MSQSTFFNFAIISLIIFAVFLVNDSFSAELPVNFFFGHSEQVLSTAFSTVDQILASAGGKEIRLWNTQTTNELAKLTGHSARVISLDFSSQGLLASSSEDETIILWDVKKLKEIRRFIGHNGAISSIAFNPDGSLLASGGNDNVVKIWEVDTGQELVTLYGHTDAVFAVSFSPDGNLIASGSGDGTIRLWSADTYQQIKVLQDHTDYVWTLAFSPDGTQLASGSWDGTVRLWNLETLEKSELLADFNTFVLAVDYSPNGELLAVGLLNCEPKNTMRIWHLKSRKELRAFETKSVHCLSFSSERNGIVVSGSSDGMIKMWNSIVDNIPVPLSPKSDTLIQTPYVTLTWYETFGAVYYEVEIAKDKNFMNIVQKAIPTVHEKFDFGVGSEVRYWWHVRSCGFGEVGDWSPSLSFKMRPELPEQAIVRIDPYSIEVYENEEFEVDVKIENAEDLIGVQIDGFVYTSEILELIELKKIGDIFGALNVKLVAPQEIDLAAWNKEGRVPNIVIVQTEHQAIPDQGVLFTAKFRTKAAGVSNLELHNVVLVDSKQNRSKCEVGWGSVRVVETVPYDVNRDGQVDIFDLVLVSKSLVDDTVYPNADVNQDGVIDKEDLNLVGKYLKDKYDLPPRPPEFPPPESPPLPPPFAPAELDAFQSIGEKMQDWLGQNYPNPFNPETWIPYRLSQNSYVTIEIYNSQGRRVRSLKVGYQLAGEYIDQNSAAYWDGRNELGEPVSSGIYFYSIYTNSLTKMKRMVILR